MELGGSVLAGETKPIYPRLALNDWTWEGIDEQGENAIIEIFIDEGTINKEQLVKILKARLPKRIYGSTSGNKNQNEGPYEYVQYDATANPTRT